MSVYVYVFVEVQEWICVCALVATTKYPTPHTRDTHAPNNQKTAQVSMLELQVPGLLERRPAVVYGDCIRFRFTAFLQSVLREREREREEGREYRRHGWGGALPVRLRNAI